jgi:hypothetical protein
MNISCAFQFSSILFFSKRFHVNVVHSSYSFLYSILAQSARCNQYEHFHVLKMHETWSGHIQYATSRLENQVTYHGEIAAQWSDLWVAILATMAITRHISVLPGLWNNKPRK